MIFAPDDDEHLNLVGSLATDCSDFAGPLEFSIGWKVGTGELKTANITVSNCNSNKVDGVDKRVANIQEALDTSSSAELSNYLSTVGLVGTSSLFIKFDPAVSFVELNLRNSNTNPFGLMADVQKKRSFQFAAGLTKVSANFEVGGSANIAAKVGPLEVEVDIDADLSGSLELKAGSKGVLLPVNDWLSKMKNITQPENAEFATVTATLDGTFQASASALGFEVSAKGGLTTPFILDLMDRTAISTKRPDVYLDIDLPNIGDLRNLSFKDVIKLLQVCVSKYNKCQTLTSTPNCSNFSNLPLAKTTPVVSWIPDWRRGGRFS